MLSPMSPLTPVTVLAPAPPPAVRPVISASLREAITAAIAARVTPSRNRLDAVARNFPPQLRANGYDKLAANLETAVTDVIGRAGDPTHPGALGQMVADVQALLDGAADA